MSSCPSFHPEVPKLTGEIAGAIMRNITRRKVGELLIQGASLVALTSSAKALMPKGRLDVTVQHDVMVKMRDDTSLATDVYMPATAGGTKFPTLLQRTPYGKAEAGTRHGSIAVANLFASNGYVVVIQDVRGRGNSQGEYVKYLADGADGFDCCKWIVEQPWSDGKIGSYGISYDAHTQGAMASANAPGIRALFMDCGGFSNAYQDGIRQGGAFELKQVTWAFNTMREAPGVRDNSALLDKIRAIDLKAWFRRMPWARGNSPLSLVPEYENYVFDQWEHGNFDAFWKQIGLYGQGYYDQYSDAATMIISSWYDAYTRTAVENYVGLSKRKKGPIKMILGPWTHGNNAVSHSGDVEFGTGSTIDRNLAPDYTTMELAWFDRYLKGVDVGSDPEPPVRIFIMGGGSGRKNADGRLEHGGKWRSESDWPLPSTKLVSYFLHSDKQLSTSHSPQGATPLRYTYDPRNPVPSIGGTITSGEPIMVGGAFDQREGPAFFGSKAPYRPLAERSDVLVFQTEPLEADTEITGAIEAHLWISSDCVDTDFTIKLIDVYPSSEDYPEGYAMNVADGIMRCRYRDSWEKPSLMRPGDVYQIAVQTFPTSNLFKAGHQIRLDVSSSNFPHFDLNLNTGAPEGKGMAIKVANNVLYVDEARPSQVILPIIPTRV